MGRLRILGWQALSVGGALLAWETAVRMGFLDAAFIPAPSAVLRALAGTAADTLPRLGDTLVKTLLGYALAVGVGVPAGLVLGSRPVAHAVAMPYVVALYGIPKILILPWIALIFGIGLSTAALSAAVFAVFPVIVLVAAGTRDVDPAIVTVAVSMGARPAQVARKVMLPAMASTLVGGLRTGLALSVVGVLVGELLGARAGLGYVINYAYGLMMTAEYAALVVLVAAAVLLLDGAGSLIEARVKRWAG